jgi:predicted AlkP superfamily phosphohydrolase/phosphomutase
MFEVLSRENVKYFVTSREGWDSLHFVFVGEDREEDALHRRFDPGQAWALLSLVRINK